MGKIIETMFDVGDVVKIPKKGGEYHKLISPKRPTYVIGKTYYTYARIIEIIVRKSVYINNDLVMNYLVYLDKEEDNFFLHQMSDDDFKKLQVIKVNNGMG